MKLRTILLCLFLLLMASATGQAQTPGTSPYPGAKDSTVTLFTAVANASTTLSSSASASTTTINVVSTASFPSSGNLALINGVSQEIVYYLSKTGTTFAGLIRAREGSSAISFPAGAQVKQPISPEHHNVLVTIGLALENKVGITSSEGSNTPCEKCVLIGGPEAGSAGHRRLTQDDINEALGYTAANQESQAPGLGDPGANGLLVRTGANTTLARSLAVGAGLSVANASGVSGNPTVSLGTSVVTSAVNDTNVTGAISNNVLTLGWTGALAKGRQHGATVYNDQANTFGLFAQTFRAGANFLLSDETDGTKKFKFDASNINTATTRTINVPDANSTTVQPSAPGGNVFVNGMSAQGQLSYLEPTVTLTGDVTGSGLAGAVNTTIANNAVTLAKFQQIATASVLGRNTAGTGNVEVLTTLPSAVQGNITRVGTIATGIWQGTAVADGFIASAATWNAKVGGSGTTATIPKFVGAGTLGDSQITDDGANINIGVNGSSVVRIGTAQASGFTAQGGFTQMGDIEGAVHSTALYVDDAGQQITANAANGFNLPSISLTGKVKLYNNAAPLDGQILIGNTAGTRFDAATLTAGTGISVTNGGGSITLGVTRTFPTTLYVHFFGDIEDDTGGPFYGTPNRYNFGTEIPVPVSYDGTFKNLRVYQPTPVGATVGWVITLYKNGSSTGLTITTSNTGGFFADTTHSVAMTTADRWSLKFDWTGVGTFPVIGGVSVEYDAAP